MQVNKQKTYVLDFCSVAAYSLRILMLHRK